VLSLKDCGANFVKLIEFPTKTYDFFAPFCIFPGEAPETEGVRKESRLPVPVYSSPRRPTTATAYSDGSTIGDRHIRSPTTVVHARGPRFRTGFLRLGRDLKSPEGSLRIRFARAHSSICTNDRTSSRSCKCFTDRSRAYRRNDTFHAVRPAVSPPRYHLQSTVYMQVVRYRIPFFKSIPNETASDG